MNIFKYLENKFSIKANNKNLYYEALTHNSYSNEKRLSKNYQRLEFLGDAVLQLKVSEYLYEKFNKCKEGMLTRYRSSIVKQATLAEIARKIELGKFIRLGIGELDTKGYEKDSILSDVYESMTAAIYLDLGEKGLKIWLENTIFSNYVLNKFLDQSHDFKSDLQELIQLEMRNNLVYETFVFKNYDNNKKLFESHVIIDNMIYGVGKGFNKKEAEQDAAKNALSKIKKNK